MDIVDDVAKIYEEQNLTNSTQSRWYAEAASVNILPSTTK